MDKFETNSLHMKTIKPIAPVLWVSDNSRFEMLHRALRFHKETMEFHHYNTLQFPQLWFKDTACMMLD